MRKIMFLVGTIILITIQSFALPTWYQSTSYNSNDGRGWSKKYKPTVVDISFDDNESSPNYKALIVDVSNAENTKYFLLNNKVNKDQVTKDYIMETWWADDYQNSNKCKIDIYLHPKTKRWFKIKFYFSYQEFIFKLKAK